MENPDNRYSHHRPNSPKSTSLTTNPLLSDFEGAAEGQENFIWAAFTENFQEVQSVLDRNRVLIQQVNENHQSKIHDNMVKNVALIQEINGNISKVVSLYSNLSANFSNVFNQPNAAATDSKSNTEENQ
ncbi:protein EARLY FLOWERING 4 [Olea europaea var. sylvestris]|uniref:EARLY FLOWERING 4 n=1 Tax=Olea europaea subsp. europaea TaxID=158383 RepID=A0A8S0UBU8_OLEEU|nr:protein EARLY FLOWERING 4 [Olea europaea var. sylvestris]CAA3014195.1 EARLY FLOWERING 4 [Olea europaea subsp. europaea]